MKDHDVQGTFFSALRHFDIGDWRSALTEEPESAAALLERAAVYGLVDAQLRWAQALLSGRGVTPDPEAAFRWFNIAARSGRADALNMVGRCFDRGWGVAVDRTAAARWYAMAAAQGDEWAQFNLAGLMLEGDGVPRDVDRAFRYYSLAADKGHCKSMTMIGRFFEEGWGVAPSMTVASEWYRRGAALGDFRGHYHLGCLHLTNGEIEAAAQRLGQAVAGAPLDFCRHFAPVWSGNDHEKIRSVGLSAYERACASGDPSDLRAYAEALDVDSQNEAARAQARSWRERAARADELRAATRVRTQRRRSGRTWWRRAVWWMRRPPAGGL